MKCVCVCVGGVIKPNNACILFLYECPFDQTQNQHRKPHIQICVWFYVLRLCLTSKFYNKTILTKHIQKCYNCQNILYFTVKMLMLSEDSSSRPLTAPQRQKAKAWSHDLLWGVTGSAPTGFSNHYNKNDLCTVTIKNTFLRSFLLDVAVVQKYNHGQ